MAGLFITVEGGEGTGKSSLIKRLQMLFQSKGKDVVVTREPGGTAAAEGIRALLVNGDPGMWSSTAEALLNNAARDHHLIHVIRPALAAGKVVICDRFIDSTRVYQGMAGDCDLALIDALEHSVVGSTRPDVTFVLDLDPAVGLERVRHRGGAQEDRYERKGDAFHQAVRKGFLAVAQQTPSRCVVIDASADQDSIFERICNHLQERGHV